MIGHSLLAAIAGSVLSATMKGSVAIILVAATLWIIGSRLSAKWRHALWLLVVIRLAMPVAPSSQWSIFNLLGVPAGRIEAAAQPRSAMHLRIAGHDRRQPPEVIFVRVPGASPLPFLFGAIWLAVAIALIGRAVIASVRMQRSVTRSLTRPSGEGMATRLGRLADEARRQLGVRRAITVVECDFVSAPALHGIVRPIVLLPRGVAESFDDAELKHVILHELWHLRRADVAVNWVLSTTQALHWFNPLVWFAVARIREERELACDELALSCLEKEEHPGYGRTILKLLERFHTPAPVPALVGIVNPKQQMKRRIRMIATFQNRKRFSALFLAAAALIGLVALTDASAGERLIKRTLDPAAHAMAEKAHERISLNLTAASLNELLAAVSAQTGVTITQAPEVASSRAAKSKFSVTATNTPAHVILMESLMPFDLMPKPDANGITIGSMEGDARVMVRHGAVAPASEPSGEVNEEVEIRVGPSGHGDERREVVVHDEVERSHAGEKHIVLKKIAGAAPKLDENGRLQRELNLKFNINGATSEGKLILDIQAPAE